MFDFPLEDAFSRRDTFELNDDEVAQALCTHCADRLHIPLEQARLPMRPFEPTDLPDDICSLERRHDLWSLKCTAVFIIEA